MSQNVRFFVRCAMFAALLCIASLITFPIGPVPVSLGIFAVMLCGVVLPPLQAVVSVGVYLLLGLFLPLFSGGHTGITALPGPTGGYIWSYLLTVVIIALFCKIPARGRAAKLSFAFIGCVCGCMVCYLCGTLQYMLIAHVSFAAGAALCVYPFILPDALKIIGAVLIGTQIKKILR